MHTHFSEGIWRENVRYMQVNIANNYSYWRQIIHASDYANSYLYTVRLTHIQI
jgi:hypothetical protein